MCWVLSEVSRSDSNIWCQCNKEMLEHYFLLRGKKGKTWDSLSRLISYMGTLLTQSPGHAVCEKINLPKAKLPPWGPMAEQSKVQGVHWTNSSHCPSPAAEVIYTSSRLARADRPGSCTQVTIYKIILARERVTGTVFHAFPPLNKPCIALYNIFISIPPPVFY